MDTFFFRERLPFFWIFWVLDTEMCKSDIRVPLGKIFTFFESRRTIIVCPVIDSVAWGFCAVTVGRFIYVLGVLRRVGSDTSTDFVVFIIRKDEKIQLCAELVNHISVLKEEARIQRPTEDDGFYLIPPPIVLAIRFCNSREPSPKMQNYHSVDSTSRDIDGEKMISIGFIAYVLKNWCSPSFCV